MRPKITRFWVKNFKSLKDIDMQLKDFNLLIGPNASGKTNIIEAFKLLTKIYSSDPHINPFLEWWGYQNVAWRGAENLPIIIGYEIQVSKYKAQFEIGISGTGGRFEILRESVNVPEVVKLEREGSKVTVNHDPNFIDEIWEKLKEIPHAFGYDFTKLKKEELITQTAEIKEGQGPLYRMGWSATYSKDIAVMTLGIIPEQRIFKIISPVEFQIKNTGNKNITSSFVMPLVALILKPFDIVTLKHFDYKAIRSPQPIRKERKLSEDGSNLANVFHTLYMEKNGVPNRIQAALESVFGENITVKPELTEDGRTYIKVSEKDFELRPTMVADGLWKLLAIMIAIETEPTLILIDELENSLHPEAIEYIVNELKNSNSAVIATTHSPAVVDIVNPEDLILVDKNEEGATIVRRVAEPEKVKKWLSERGITLSEGWLYGELS